MNDNTLVEYRLGSSPIIYAPGWVAWAINGYQTPGDRDIMIQAVRDGWRIPEHAAIALLSKAATYVVEDEVVVFWA